MKKIVVLLASLVIIVNFSATVSAAEITPNASTYSHGSTSEFAEAAVIQAPESEGLADTGQAQGIVYVIGTALVLMGTGIIVIMRRKHLAKR